MAFLIGTLAALAIPGWTLYAFARNDLGVQRRLARHYRESWDAAAAERDRCRAALRKIRETASVN